jgi:hypothetical protein
VSQQQLQMGIVAIDTELAHVHTYSQTCIAVITGERSKHAATAATTTGTPAAVLKWRSMQGWACGFDMIVTDVNAAGVE